MILHHPKPWPHPVPKKLKPTKANIDKYLKDRDDPHERHGIEVECQGCGAIVYTGTNFLLVNMVHLDWKMDADCNLQQIRNIMEE